MRKLRQYQTDAIESVENELIVREKSKCLVKMFCGTGKSIVMYQLFVLRIVSPLSVFVFPSLALIDQFYTDYIVKLKFNLDSVIKVSSEVDSTTDEDVVREFLSNDSIKQKIVCITYQSFEVLLNCGKAIDVACFDEAHHAVGQVSQKLIFNNDTIKKQVFFTATPKNENGIVMYDADDESKNMCGKLVYDYTYLNGVWEGYLNPFEIRMDFYMENTNKSVYESIARAVLVSGNSRVLTFHSAVDSESESTTSVKNFVDSVAFKSAFDWVIESEFPEKRGVYVSVKMCGLYAQIKASERKKILKEFDKTPDNEVYVIASCQTIGEGVDTKNANMCVFVDPKSSYTGIIQNIGRIVRKVEGVAKPNSTILLPCWVDKEKYIGCGGDREKQDEVIRRDMSESGGNFNAILNVMSALKQEDEDLYEICLYYPDCYAPVEIYSSLERQGLRVDEEACDGDVGECLEHLLEDDVEYEEDESDAEMIMRVADENGVCVEVHTNSLEVPIERFNDGEKREYVRMYRDEEGKYMPIVDDEERKKGKKRSDVPMGRANRFKTSVHTNPDVKVLWNVVGDVGIVMEI
jgi:superfamily II DNA or RNA helicase